MGILRLLLALSVVITHSTPILGWEGVGGTTAVQAFYIISGFYMALILHEKYTSGSYKLFITNRLLRLYPIFWVVLLATVATSVCFYIFTGNGFQLQYYVDYGHSMSLTSLLFLIGTNIALIGQDIVMFLGLNTATGSLFFTSNFHQTSPQLYKFLFIPQAWTIAVEIMFYLIVPFLARRKTWLLLLLFAASIGIRVWLYSIGLKDDPWNYRFFPSELAWFIAGILSYRWYRFVAAKPGVERWTVFFLPGILLLTFAFQFIPIGMLYKKLGYYSAIAFSLPFLFMRTKSNKRDAAIGEYSYPVYISHYLVIQLITVVFQRLNLPADTIHSLLGIVGSAGSLLFSALLIRYIATPVEHIRQRRVKAAAEASRAKQSDSRLETAA